jgi:hypothetical protein
MKTEVDAVIHSDRLGNAKLTHPAQAFVSLT